MEDACRARGGVIWGGITPCPKPKARIFAGASRLDNAPEAIFARYCSLSGEARQSYFQKNSSAIWDHWEKTRKK